MQQQWQQIEFTALENSFSKIENFLFDNLACSVTNIKKDNNEIFITVLYEDELEVSPIINNLKNTFNNEILSEIEYKIIKDQEWTSAWLDDYEPINISEKIVIYPSWKPLPNDNEKIYIKVDPSVAFGCGNHETTKMCLQWIEKYTNKNSQILDYGCGTGILAIAGSLLGAKFAEGVDIDENSVKSSKINAQENNVENNTNFDFQTYKKDFDLLVANIFSNVLISLADVMLSKLKIGGKIALSGILKEQVEEVKNAFENKGIIFDEVINLGQWYLLSGVKNGL